VSAVAMTSARAASSPMIRSFWLSKTSLVKTGH
jgi:hypothetical protein